MNEDTAKEKLVLYQLVCFLLKQVGGSVALNPVEQIEIFSQTNPDRIEVYQTLDPPNMVIQVKESK